MVRRHHITYRSIFTRREPCFLCFLTTSPMMEGCQNFEVQRPWRHPLGEWHTHPIPSGTNQDDWMNRARGRPFANPCRLTAFCIAFDTTKRLQVTFPTRAPGLRSVPTELAGRKWVEGLSGRAVWLTIFLSHEARAPHQVGHPSRLAARKWPDHVVTMLTHPLAPHPLCACFLIPSRTDLRLAQSRAIQRLEHPV